MGILFIGRGISYPSHLWMRRQLAGLGKDVSVLVTTSDNIDKYRSIYKVVILKEKNMRLLWRISRLVSNIRLIKEIRSRRVSRVLIHYLTDAVRYKNVIKNTDKPVFVHCHGYDVTWDICHQTGPRYGLPMHKADYINNVLSLPSNVNFIANSETTKNRLLDIGIDHNRIFVKYLGVDVPASFQNHDQNKTSLTILYLGRLVDCKGPDLVIRAFEIACDKGLNATLSIAGDGPLAMMCELLRAHSKYRDRITLLGSVDAERGRCLRSSADIFTAHNCIGPISKQEEAFGVSLVEAMAAGLPIVNTSSGSVPEIIENKLHGILVEPGDIEGHANAFLRLEEEPALRKKYGINGWNRVKEKFSLKLEITTLRNIMNK